MNVGLIIALGLSLVFAVLLYKLLKAFWPLLYNAMFGIAAFWVLSTMGVLRVPINVWTVLIAAIGGIFGVAVVILLTALGIPL